MAGVVSDAKTQKCNFSVSILMTSSRQHQFGDQKVVGTLEELLRGARGLKLVRGQVYRVPNSVFTIFVNASTTHHPALVCHSKIRHLAPGTSASPRNARNVIDRRRMGGYTLSKSNAPNGKQSTFFLRLRIEVAEAEIGKHWWTIDDEDLVAISAILGHEREA